VASDEETTVPETYSLALQTPDLRRDLASWLDQDEAKGWTVKVSPKPPGPGEMGSQDVLLVLLGSGGLGGLVTSLQMWIKYRQPKVKLTIKGANGHSVQIDATNAGDVEEIVRSLKGDS
jgi:hypothetical protein